MKFLRRLSCLWIACLILPTTLQAGRGHWTGNGPFGAWITAIAATTDGQVIYAGTDLGEVFRSSDGGAQWDAADPSLYAYSYQKITSIAIEPGNSSTVFVAADGRGIFKSTDAGNSWIQVNSGFTSPPSLCSDIGACSPNVLAVDPSNGNTVLAGTDNGLFRTTDGGESWSLLEPDGYPSDVVQTIVYDPADTNTIYVGESLGLYKTTDGGETWSAQDGGLIEPSVTSLAIDPADPSVLWAVDEVRGAFRINGGGATWTPIPAPLGTRRILVDPATPSTLYGFGPNGIFRSVNAGNSWRSAGYTASPPDSFQVVLFAGSPPTLLAGTASGFLESSDQGTTWQGRNQGIREVSVSSIAVGPIAQPSIFAAVSTGSLETMGAGWIAGSPVNANDWSALSGTVDGLATSVVIDPVSPMNVYAVVGLNFLRSTDGGRTWELISNGNFSFGWLAVGPTNPVTIYSAIRVATRIDPIVRSTDGGNTWVSLNFPFDNSRGPLLPAVNSGVVVDPNRAGRVYVAGDFGIARTTDDGGTWVKLSNGYPNASALAIAIDPKQTLTLYAGTLIGVFKTVDGGDHWVKVNGNSQLIFVQSLAVDPADSRIVYAGTQTGIQVSRDGGDTWSDLSLGLPHPTMVFSLAVDPAGERVFAGTDRGVYEFTMSPDLSPVPSPVIQSIPGHWRASATIHGPRRQSTEKPR